MATQRTGGESCVILLYTAVCTGAFYQTKNPQEHIPTTISLLVQSKMSSLSPDLTFLLALHV